MQTYLKTKDSGAKYIGDVPEEWSMLRASVLFKENKKTNKDLTSLIPVQFKFGEIIEKNIDVDEIIREEIKRYIVVEQNDIMINGLNLNYDFLTQRVAIVKNPGCITPAYISLKTREIIHPKFACYLLKALDGQKVLNGWGTGIRLTLNFSEFKKYYLPNPSLKTQQNIVSYLNEETAKIDNLIAKQEKLLKLLEEKRRATITHAVTRGLDPKVELNETNIPWLDQIPSHWKIRKLNHLTALLIGSTPSTQNPDDFDGSEVWVTIADMKERIVMDSKQKLTGEAAANKNMKKVPKGSVLFSFKLSVGKVAYCGIDLYTNEAIAAFVPKRDITSEFLYYASQSYFINEAGENIYGAAIFNQELLKAVHIATPPEDEQYIIAKYLDKENIIFNELRDKIMEQILLLKERRTSLISHAVTGKIMV